jgi:hypothetical protein
MKNSLRFLMCVVSVGLVGSAARAEEKMSIKEKQARTAAEAELKTEVDRANTACGTTLTETINWASFKGTDPAKYSISGYCGNVMAGVRKVCEGSPEGKEAVKKNLKKVDCALGGEGKRSAAVKDGTLSFKVDWNAGSDDDFVKAYLENNL